MQEQMNMEDEIRTALNAELRRQRRSALYELESAQRTGDSLLVELMLARIDDLDTLAARHGEDLLS